MLEVMVALIEAAQPQLQLLLEACILGYVWVQDICLQSHTPACHSSATHRCSGAHLSNLHAIGLCSLQKVCSVTFQHDLLNYGHSIVGLECFQGQSSKRLTV